MIFITRMFQSLFVHLPVDISLTSSPGGPLSGKAGGSRRHGSAASICAGLCTPHPRTVDPRPPLGGHSGRSHAGECGTGPSSPARSDTCSVRSAAERARAESHVNEIPAQRTQSGTESARSLELGRWRRGRGLHEGMRGLDSEERAERSRTAGKRPHTAPLSPSAQPSREAKRGVS